MIVRIEISTDDVLFNTFITLNMVVFLYCFIWFLIDKDVIYKRRESKIKSLRAQHNNLIFLKIRLLI